MGLRLKTLLSQSAWHDQLFFFKYTASTVINFSENSKFWIVKKKMKSVLRNSTVLKSALNTLYRHMTDASISVHIKMYACLKCSHLSVKVEYVIYEMGLHNCQQSQTGRKTQLL